MAIHVLQRGAAETDRGRPESRCAAPPGDGPEDHGPGILGDPARFGLWAFLGTVAMLFIGFTSAYILRRSAADWRPLQPPSLLWFNTAALLASSLTLEGARRRLRSREPGASQAALLATGLLGLLFTSGQVLAWRQLAAQGVFLSSNPHSAFFYLLTGVHVVHLAGGLLWFATILARSRRERPAPDEKALGLFATYWHFLAALWLYLLFLLFAL